MADSTACLMRSAGPGLFCCFPLQNSATGERLEGLKNDGNTAISHSRDIRVQKGTFLKTICRHPVIGLRTPVIVLVLAATVIPVELRPLSRAHLGFSIEAYDVAENIAAFVVVGLVLGEMGFLKAVIVGTLISTFAEASQLFMVHRDPSVIDVMSNVIGTILGALISARWRLHSPELRIGKWK